MFQSFLPKLIDLNVAYNNLTKLDKDFYGLPVLCLVDLSHNQISYISPDLVTNTRCITHSTGVVSILNIKIDGEYLENENYQYWFFFNTLFLYTDNPILCHDELDEIINAMKAQEANLTGLGHCISPTDFIDDSETIPGNKKVSNELPMNEIDRVEVNVENNVLDLAPSVPPAVLFIPTTTPALLVIDIPSTETPIVMSVQSETLHFVSLETSTDEVNLVHQLPILQTIEQVTTEKASSLDLTESLSFINTTTKEVTTVLPDSNELVTDPLPFNSYLPESAPNWSKVDHTLPVEPPPPEPILAEDSL